MKRVFDVLSSLFLLIILFPVLMFSFFLVWYFHGLPILFKQKRPGKNCKPFYLLKFRSMTSERDLKGELLPNKDRLTKFGKLLRATSLDELPSILNVLKGDMSLVGPRPLKMDYIKLYNSEQKRRHEVKPGITGWAQVNGRNAISFSDRFKMDVWYVENRNLLLDIKILYLTIKNVFLRKDINSPDEVDVKPFDGTN